MQFKFPFIDVLTIPTGAGPGDARIEIDGVNGEIRVYDSNGDLVGKWDSTDFTVQHPTNGSYIQIIPSSSGDSIIALNPDEPTGYQTGKLFARSDALGTPEIFIFSPVITGEDNAVISIIGENSADSVRPSINFDVREGQLTYIQATDSSAMAGGYRHDAFSSTNSAAIPAGTETVVRTISNMIFRDNRAYLVTWGSMLQSDTANGNGVFRFRKTNAGGTLYGDSGQIPTPAAGTTYHAQGHWYVRRNKNAGDLTTDVVLTLDAGAGNATHVAVAEARRHLLIEDIGSASEYQFAFSVT